MTRYGHKAAVVVDTDSQLITGVDVLPGNATDNVGALELARRVKYTVDEQAWMGEKRGLTIVSLKDGRTISRSTPDVLGMSNRPGDRQDMLNKFWSNAVSVMVDSRRVDALIEALEALDEVDDIGSVMEMTVP